MNCSARVDRWAQVDPPRVWFSTIDQQFTPRRQLGFERESARIEAFDFPTNAGRRNETAPVVTSPCKIREAIRGMFDRGAVREGGHFLSDSTNALPSQTLLGALILTWVRIKYKRLFITVI